ncbi:glutamate--cysteine ligase [Thioalkalivibrio denitrificans]|uniref:Glutamate--cysteine ligase n=1 Tax=Thioalkalivibrio denitrificans TaxID=108003 RepID=A0A1V3NDX2_9GAMM|nr:glutamate--cysteine ligase [Thioalkalivibrio denitrificans]OOG23287.1 glutamate--cysteine ligase [Thioalkalivibrio denitrificans]
MGQEINTTRFKDRDFQNFRQRVAEETRLARDLEAAGRFDDRHPVAGFEIEAWLVDAERQPAPVNNAFLDAFHSPLATPELARFNVELNTEAHGLRGTVFSDLHREMTKTWTTARDAAHRAGAELLLTGILPTLRAEHLCLENMSDMKRYRALNEQVFRSREGRPLKLDIVGREHLHHEHHDVMLEAATTSFQIHIQTPVPVAHKVYNASILASAPVVALSANSPFLFGHDLWDETRIPVFEQSVEVGGYREAARGPLRRVSFGSGFARESILECFEENLEHFPPLLPIRIDEPVDRFPHLRLHNGTIWRWNRPLIGFDEHGRPHVRIEHRVVPAGPTLADSIATAAFYYGLVEELVNTPGGPEGLMDFSRARDNFYESARLGLGAHVEWPAGTRRPIRDLILNELLPRARAGLARLGIDENDSTRYLDIVEARVEQARNGAAWARSFMAAHGRDGRALVDTYLAHQLTDTPVHDWPPAEDTC